MTGYQVVTVMSSSSFVNAVTSGLTSVSVMKVGTGVTNVLVSVYVTVRVMPSMISFSVTGYVVVMVVNATALLVSVTSGAVTVSVISDGTAVMNVEVLVYVTVKV